MPGTIAPAAPALPANLAELRQHSVLLDTACTNLETARGRLSELLNMRALEGPLGAEFDELTGSEGERSIPAMEANVARLADAAERSARLSGALTSTGEAGSTVPVQRAASGVTVVREPETYRKGGQASYFRDLMAVNMNRGDMRSASERLERNSREVSSHMQERALTTTDGAGGEFVPPVWMVDQFIELARAGRVAADLARQIGLPGGTDSINLPRLATGTAVAEQATQNTAIQNTDATTNSVPVNVATIAGQQVISVQLLEQSPINMDEILLADLAADYAIKLDVFCLSNNATGKVGYLSVSGVNAVTYTDASPTFTELWPKLADAVQQVHTNRIMPPDAILMHPRRWGWLLAATDTAGRPLIVADANAPMNSAGSASGVITQGRVGTIMGLPVYVDANIPINLGAGTNEDRIIVGRFADSVLMEGNARSEAFRETKADQLSVLLRFYNYAAFTASRYAKSLSVISGTGLVTPTF